ncbi:MAG: FeS-binding protein [Desulfuromonas sp.]|nr:MAG: FeS-binding protein [Desulfuromonas sp.]
MPQSQMSAQSLSCIGPRRRSFQWILSLLVVLLPWFKIDGKSLLRIDIPELSFYFFGAVLRIEELYLLLIVCLVLVLGFLLITLAFGRVWCGWACPQTTLNDISEWLARKLGLNISKNRLQGPAWRRAIIHIIYVVLAFAIAANLLWYFIEPRQFFSALVSGSLHSAAWATLMIIFITIYIDLAFIRRLMCSEFCPYGRIQTALVDPGTLTLHIPESENERCIECGSCVRACPMEIDIRNGFQVECINCGRCLDACRQVMKRRKEPGLICYSFGTENRGVKALLNPRMLLVTISTLCLLVILGIAMANRADATLKLSHSHQVAPRRLANGTTATFFNAWINNREQQVNRYRLRPGNWSESSSLSVRGQTENIKVEAGGNRRIDFVLVSPHINDSQEVVFYLEDSQGNIVASASALIKADINESNK